MPSEALHHPHHPEERADLFTASDGGSIETEFQELLAGLVRSFKPYLVLETGTASAATTRVLAQACQANGSGHVISLEIKEELAQRNRHELREFANVTLYTASSTDWLCQYTGPPFGLAVLDSDLRTRIQELKILIERKLVRGPVFVHDTSRLRAAGGLADWPEYPAELDALNLPGLECPLSRGWRLFQLKG